MKAGLMEIADLFVVNKADREGADRLEQQLHAMLAVAPARDGWQPPVVRTIASENKGIDLVEDAIVQCRRHRESVAAPQRGKIEYWKRRLLDMLEGRLLERVFARDSSEAMLEDLAAAVAERKMDPFSAVQEILARGGLG